MGEKLIRITSFNTDLNEVLNSNYASFNIYRSKGLLTHLINRKHFIAAKYIDKLPEIINFPDYVGCSDVNIELVKVYKDSIMISIKLDKKDNKYYVATMFDVKAAKIDAYVNSGRLRKVNNT